VNKSFDLIYILTGLDYGGAEIQVIELAKEAKKRGYNVVIISLVDPKAFLDTLQNHGISVYSLNIKSILSFIPAVLNFRSILKRYKKPVIHSHMIHANIFSRVAKLILGTSVKVVCTAHSVNEGGRVRMFLYRITNILCDLSTQVSIKGLNKYIEIKAFSDKKSRYVPNGVSFDFLDDSYNKGSKTLEFKWLTVGRLVDVKDHHNLLYAFSSLSGSLGRASLTIVGQGELESQLKGLAISLGVEEKVHFLGVRDDILNIMTESDAFVLSSKYEGMPMVLLEAASARLPIVSTNVGGINEFISNGSSGILVSPESKDSLKIGMECLMGMPLAERELLVSRAFETAHKNYSICSVFNTWENIYFELNGLQ